MNRKKRKRGGGNGGVSFARCVIASAGFVFGGLPFWIASFEELAAAPPWAGALLVGMFLLGLFLMLAAILGSKKQVESLLEATTRNDASLAFVILAAPIYLFLKLWGRGGK